MCINLLSMGENRLRVLVQGSWEPTISLSLHDPKEHATLVSPFKRSHPQTRNHALRPVTHSVGRMNSHNTSPLCLNRKILNLIQNWPIGQRTALASTAISKHAVGIHSANSFEVWP